MAEADGATLTRSDELLDIRRLTGALGAQVSGLDLTRPLGDHHVTAIIAALTEHQVLFFRGQPLTEDQHRAVASRFGNPSIYPVQRIMGGSEPLHTIEDDADNPPKADNWHTDISWLPEPPSYAFLHALDVPDHGGDTMWVSLFAIHDALSPAMQAFCAGLTARHAPTEKQLAAFQQSSRIGPEIAEKIRAIFQPVAHPLVRTHPISGRPALYLSDFLDRIVDLQERESEMLLGYLNGLLDDPNHQIRWNWRQHDFAIWDEASTNHRALSDHYPQFRRMRRCTVDGDAPFYRTN